MKQQTIVVLEDEAVTRTMLVDCLSQINGFNVIEFGSATQFLDHLNAAPSFQVDVIFSDIEMPGLNGVELLRMIRTGNTRLPRDTQTVVISSYSADQVVGSALALDASAYLNKPFSQEQLLYALQQSLGKTPDIKPEIAYKVINTQGLVPQEKSANIDKLLTEEELAFIQQLV